MTLRNAAQQVLTEAREGIAWIIIYKEGRSWNAEPFWPDYNEKAGILSFDSEDLPRIHEILTADPSAVIVNGYESNLGDTESMTRDTLVRFLRWQYEGQYSRLSDRIQPTAARYLEQVEQADSLDELDTVTETAANDDTLTAAEYEAIHSAALHKAQGWDPQNKPQETTENAVEILVNGHLVRFSTCTAIAASIGDTARQPALFVHDCTDRDGNGDGVIFGVDTPPETPEEAAAMLEEHLDTYQETLKTVEPAHRYTAETYQDNAGRAHLAVLDRSGTCVYYLVDAGRELIQDAIAALCKGGDPVAEQWDGGEDDPAAAYQWICEAVEARNGGAWETDPARLFEAVSR